MCVLIPMYMHLSVGACEMKCVRMSEIWEMKRGRQKIHNIITVMKRPEHVQSASLYLPLLSQHCYK